ncbi:TPA_asm: nucleoprotein [Sphaeridiorhabdovirus 2]|nr:TPA_asm: nucleoprotein [Sphaeridiorhabdovirus 2]
MTATAEQTGLVDLGRHSIYDVRLKKFVEVEGKVHTSILVPQYYPEEQPIAKIKFSYQGLESWTLEAAASKVYQCLKASALPPLDIQIYFLVKYNLSKNYKALEDIQVGGHGKAKGETFNGSLFVDFEMTNSESTLETLTPVSVTMYEGLAAWLLLQARIGKGADDPVRTDYYTNIITGLKRISSAPPLNIPATDLLTFPSSPSDFALIGGSNQILFLAAVYDYCALASEGTANMTIRYSTLTTRFHDHLSLSLLHALTTTRLIPSDKIIDTFITEGLARDGLQILKKGNGVGKKYSLTPYTRAMGLISKSCYSLTENPHFATFASVLIACAGTPNQTLITHTGVSVDVEITVAIKLFNYILSVANVGRFAVDGPERPPTEQEMQDLQISSAQDFNDVLVRIIQEVKVQGGKPTEVELESLKKKLDRVPVRNGSLCQYIRSMTPYTPSPIEFDFDETHSELTQYP